ncbi:MAG: hypothetical protein R3B06_16105 [Kofleriaceae bacterium]
MSARLTTLALAGALVGTGCGREAGPGPLALDVNDVSFLLPIWAPAALPPLADFVTPAQFDQLGFANEFVPPAEALARSRVVAVRVDPCFPAAGGCQLQVRLVAQPLSAQGAADGAIHLFYQLASDERGRLRDHLAALVDLADGRTAGVALGPHPVLAPAGLATPYGDALRALLADLCTPDRLTEIAVMNGGEVTWTFFRFGVAADGAVTPRLTTGGGPGAKAPAQRSVLVRDGLRAPGELFDAQVPVTTAALALARRFEDPRATPTPLLDCGSCHAVTPARIAAELASGLASEELAFVAPPGTTATIAHRATAPGHFRGFGYAEGFTAEILDRTVFESTLAAADLAQP